MKEKNRAGLTLLEIVVAMAILGIIVMATLAMFTSGFRLTTLSNWHNKSTFNSQMVTEQALFVKNTNPAATGIEFRFSDGTTINAPGEVRISNQTVNGVTTGIWFFQPKN